MLRYVCIVLLYVFYKLHILFSSKGIPFQNDDDYGFIKKCNVFFLKKVFLFAYENLAIKYLYEPLYAEWNATTLLTTV